MHRVVRNDKKEESPEVSTGDSRFESAIDPGLDKNRFELLPTLAGAIFIFVLLYFSSYLALLWLPPYEGLDMESQLTADYSAWNFLVFQPVDPAIIEEIRQEQGLPEQIVNDGEFWSTPASTFTVPPQATHATASTPQATGSSLPPKPSAFPPTYTSTPIPTSVMTTPQPTVDSVPTATRRTHRTPKPHKTQKPKP
jgi:hypothetical protein